MMNYPDWKEDLAALMCIIDPDDGARMYGQLTDCAPDKGHIGMRVEAHFADISEEAAIPKLRPVQRKPIAWRTQGAVKYIVWRGISAQGIIAKRIAPWFASK